MASVQELRDALRENLDRKGTLKELRARVRASVYRALGGQEVHKPELSNENLIINELIREYLVFNNYRETLSVLIPEAGQPDIRPFDRSFLAQHLSMQDGPNSQQLPLLYSLVAARQQAPPSAAPTPGVAAPSVAGAEQTSVQTATER